MTYGASELTRCTADHVLAGFGRYQWLLMVYAGSVWAADAMEMMLLSFIGPAVRPSSAQP